MKSDHPWHPIVSVKEFTYSILIRKKVMTSYILVLEYLNF